MALADVDRRSVERAVVEHDQIGRSAFLRKYGFDRSRNYFLLLDGLTYDSKAICGAAHGHLDDDRTPLHKEDFSGGVKGAAGVLERLGFQIVETAKIEITNDQGVALGSSCELGRAGKRWTITMNSRGGKKGSAEERNPGYLDGLEAVLRRLGQHSAELVDVILDTSDTRELVQKGELDPQALHLLGTRSVDLAAVSDYGALKDELTASAAAVRSNPSAKGRGNPTKEIRLEFLLKQEVSAARLRSLIIEPNQDRATHLLTVHSNRWPVSEDERLGAAAETAAGQRVRMRWPLQGPATALNAEDLVFLCVADSPTPGIVARGRVAGGPSAGQKSERVRNRDQAIEVEWAEWLGPEDALVSDDLRTLIPGRLDEATTSLARLSDDDAHRIGAAWRSHVHATRAETTDTSPTERDPGAAAELPGGRSIRTVRARVGQRRFRDLLLRRFGAACAITGPHPVEVLEAAHLYSFADTEFHDPFGGLLLRRDVHRLFDSGLICVDPRTLTVDVDPTIRPYPTYQSLHGSPMLADLPSATVDWLELHWREHRGPTL